MKIKAKRLLEFNNGLNTLGNVRGVKFIYAVNKNKRLIRNEIESINEAMKPSDEYDVYEKERVKLAENYARKDGNGNPVKKVQNGVLVYDIEEVDDFNDEMSTLKEDYADVISEREKQINEVLEMEIDVNLHLVNLSDVPGDITERQLDMIFEMIKEEN